MPPHDILINFFFFFGRGGGLLAFDLFVILTFVNTNNFHASIIFIPLQTRTNDDVMSMIIFLHTFSVATLFCPFSSFCLPSQLLSYTVLAH